jgi:ribosomal protein S6--L-glutamate ligase
MKIGILSRNPSLFSTRRLARAAWARGHQVRIIDTTSVAVHIGREGQPAGYLLSPGSLGLQRPVPLPALDAIIPRIGASVTFYGLAVLRQLEAGAVVTTAAAEAIAQSRDKLHSLQLMNRAGLSIPRTAMIARPEALYAAVHAVGGLPVVVKLIRGTQGRGVLLAHDLPTIQALLRQANAGDRQALIQEFIAEAGGRDLRVLVVGGRCVAAMERRAGAGEFRANIHLGATGVPAAIDSETEALAVRAAAVHGLAVAGVDLIPSDRGPLLLEVNSSPGLEGIERATGVDVAGAIIDYLERALAERLSR